ncbi:MAG TPA: lamin tail domain-containing protein, partial [Cyclobacteriaceae bacterium]|nr:lamin tail domain-containing protein [Cyclobacteriaceae bacterium]
TSTRSDKFFFDNFTVIGDPYMDVDPPALLGIEVLSPQELLIHFNELIDPSSTDKLLYALNGQINPATVSVQSDGKSIKLSFTQQFQNGITSELNIIGLKDLAGNALFTTDTFLYFQSVPTKAKDIIFTEIFADPSPQIKLPDAEYVEIYNRSMNPIHILGWQLSDGSSIATLPDKIVLPNEYWVITSPANVSKFGMNGSVLGVTNFPTLNNSNDALTLKTSSGNVIDSVNYSLSWYKNLDKQEGGWTLEIVDPDNLCEEQNNWTASESEKGGTPGVANSVDASNLDLAGPKLLSVTPIDPKTILLRFDERLEAALSPNAAFVFQPEVQIESFAITDLSLRSIRIAIESELVTRQLYSLSINNVFDCSGNKIEENNNFEFALPEDSEPGDVIINEILFNPRPNGVDFVEVYNRTDKFINLKNWSIGNLEEDKITNGKILFVNDYIMKPLSFMVFTPDPINVKSNYPQGHEKSFIASSLPSMPDDEGSVAIANEQGMVVDSFIYSEGLHNDLVRDPEGISLERISIMAPSQDQSNWTSASSVSGFATPGFQNSSYRMPGEVDIGDIKVDPEIFSPNSGFSEFTQIHFNLDNTGYTSNVKIFDQQGRLIRTIANNQILGATGSFRWEGEQEDGTRARAGYYLVWFEIFNSTGSVKTFRKRVIIASR